MPRRSYKLEEIVTQLRQAINRRPPISALSGRKERNIRLRR